MDTPLAQPVTPEANQPVQPPPVVSPPPPAKKNSSVLIGILLLLLGILVGLAIDKTTILSNIRIPYLSATPTPTLLPTPSPTPDPTANWKTITSDQFKFSLRYPPDWNYYNDANNDILKLPYVRNFSAQNETIVKANGCAIHFGFGGGSGPSNEIQSNNVKLDNLSLNRKTWLIQSNPVFGSYTYEGVPPASKKFELLLVWISKDDPSSCQTEIDQILSTFRFIDQNRVNCPTARPEVCTMECAQPPPYICGSDGKSYCSVCQACSNPGVSWYVMQATPCENQ